MYVSVLSTCICVLCACLVPKEDRKGIKTGVGEPPFESWELNLGLLQEAANALNC